MRPSQRARPQIRQHQRTPAVDRASTSLGAEDQSMTAPGRPAAVSETQRINHMPKPAMRRVTQAIGVPTKTVPTARKGMTRVPVMGDSNRFDSRP